MKRIEETETSAVNRRRLLQGAGVVSVAAIAGCLGGDDDDAGDDHDDDAGDDHDDGGDDHDDAGDDHDDGDDDNDDDDDDEIPTLSVLYLGDSDFHNPAGLRDVIQPYLEEREIELTYTEDQDDLLPETLHEYDAYLQFGNRDTIEEDQLDSLIEFVENGGGFVALHSASASFTHSDEFISLVGGQFAWHGHETMTTDRIEPDHPVFEGVEEIEAHEETYRHQNLNDDIEVLAHGADGDYEEDEDEPFTWVREQGDGRVFYTAWGHDENAWEETGFQQKVENAIRWTSGNEDTIGQL